MKRTALFILILAILSVSSQQIKAQKANFETNGGMTIGFGMGPSYQQSDIANPSGGGFDFTLGSFIYKRENAFLSVDWKFRFLAGENFAHDHRINPDMTFSNIKYSFFNYDAEIGLTLNRLRERTRIVVTGFAGVGITHGRTFTDLYDANGLLYDYSTINTNQDKDLIVADILTLLDRDYETRLVNKGSILPTLGFFIGYQFSRSFSMGIEHKTTFSLTEHNSMTGINIDNKIMTGSGIDMSHYTALSFKWNLGRGGSSRNYSSSSYSYQSPVTNPVTSVTPQTIYPVQTNANRPPVNDIPTPTYNNNSNVRDNVGNTNTRPAATPLPVVSFVNPSTNITVDRNVYSINVRTQNVKAWQDVTVKVNDVNTTNFNFSNTGVVTTNIGLREGLNTVVVSGKNESGTVQAQVIITYVRPVNVAQQSTNVVQPETVADNNSVSRTPITNQPPRNVEPEAVVPPVVQPEVVTPPAVQPEVVTPPVVEPEIVAPPVEEPEVVAPPVVEPEVVTPPVVEPEIVAPPVEEPEVVAPPVVEPEVVTPPVVEPEVVAPPVMQPEVATPPVVEPEVVAPPVVEPEVVTPPVVEPEVVTPPVVQPEVVTPPVVEPEVVATPVAEPEVVAPPVVEPAVTQPVVVESVVTQPEVVVPPVVQPEVVAPPAVEPEVVAPPAVEPEVVAPPVVEPVEETCGTRINPGNSTWQFCMVTPNGTITRDNLSNSNFSYSGPVSSLYFLSIGGGSDATVSGRPYTIRAGQYYLFTGNITVTVSTKNPGSMGQWSVCIIADRAPVFGNGNNRPKSPCEVTVQESVQEKAQESVRETVRETGQGSSQEKVQETATEVVQEAAEETVDRTERVVAPGRGNSGR